MPYEIPPRKKPSGDNGYFEELTKAIFQAGFSWRVIRDKWSNFQRAFDQFDIAAIAGYGEPDVDWITPAVAGNSAVVSRTWGRRESLPFFGVWTSKSPLGKIVQDESQRKKDRIEQCLFVSGSANARLSYCCSWLSSSWCSLVSGCGATSGREGGERILTAGH
jgi:hypothetical protein